MEVLEAYHEEVVHGVQEAEVHVDHRRVAHKLRADHRQVDHTHEGQEAEVHGVHQPVDHKDLGVLQIYLAEVRVAASFHSCRYEPVVAVPGVDRVATRILIRQDKSC